MLQHTRANSAKVSSLISQWLAAQCSTFTHVKPERNQGVKCDLLCLHCIDGKATGYYLRLRRRLLSGE